LHGSYTRFAILYPFSLKAALLIDLAYPGETIPPTPDCLLKFTFELSFTHMAYHEQLKKAISIPPDPVSQNIWSQDIPLGLKQELRRVMKHMYGTEAEGLEAETYKMCWYGVPHDPTILDRF
jgi:hypothetical protein